MITPGQTDGLVSLTHLTKKAMIFVVPLDVSIQATGMPIWEMLAPLIKYQLLIITMSPLVPGNDREQQ